MSLSELKCPKCRETLHPLQQKVVKTNSYLDCLRRCDRCGVAFSNARSNPTVIYQNPLHNVPAPVRADARRVLETSLNEKNRRSKWQKFGYSTSEDAVTWTVFSYLVAEPSQALIRLGKRWLGTEADEPTMLLWGVPISPTADGAAVRERLIHISDFIGESPLRRTEPDVILDFGRSGIVLIEVKLNSKNENIEDTRRMHKYLADTRAFSSPGAIEQSGLYQLARNWRFGWDLAGEKRFRLVNLAPAALFDGNRSLKMFEQGLPSCARTSFVKETWEDMLSELSGSLGGLPTWLTTWLATRPWPPYSKLVRLSG